MSTRYAKYTSTIYSYTAKPTQTSSPTHDECSSAFALRRSLSTPGKPNWVSKRSNTSVTLSQQKVLNFPQPSNQKDMLQFIGLANYFRDHVSSMTEMVKPLREMIPQGKYQKTSKLVWTTESSAAFQHCQQAISNCQELYFLEDTATSWRIPLHLSSKSTPLKPMHLPSLAQKGTISTTEVKEAKTAILATKAPASTAVVPY